MKVRQNRDFLILSGFGLALLCFTFLTPTALPLQKNTETAPSGEIKNILALKNTREQSAELLKLLERVGPEKAQEELVRSGLPFTGETHLLIHTVGNFIYDQFGKDGLSYCKDYFLSACYHAVILNTLGDNGLEGVAEAMEICEQAGGYIVSAQCAHGAGHGFVAWHDYDLIKALEMCDALGAETENFAYFNCYDGAFMENVWGVHNGVPSEKRWVKAEDINYPCNDSRIPEKYLNGCWSNQATLAYQLLKGDLKKTAELCDSVENPSYRETCYNNFSRQIHPLTQGQTEKVHSLCEYATGFSWRDYCILTNMTSYWSVGDREIPYQICESLTGSVANDCFARLKGLIAMYYAKSPERNDYCRKISNKIYRDECLAS
jgi:hypothetical protein